MIALLGKPVVVPLLVLAGWALTVIPASASVQPPKEDQPEKGIEVQAHGPIHEAFAQPSTITPEPGPIIKKKPPAPIPEEPPEQKPAGDNVQWIPGYWAWDSGKTDWMWVSGLWRVPPPNRKWVPGHWAEGTEGGWQWAAGFWAAAKLQELNYQRTPPDSLENGASSPMPDQDSIYVPGLWVPRGERFAWRPGYWLGSHRDWVWNAAHYNWTPNGNVYIDGYWDYPLEDRGVLFAPVTFSEPLWTTPGWSYSPQYVVGIDPLYDNLFVRPGYNSFFFGNYYNPWWGWGWGFQPWFAFGGRFHDPLFGFNRWRNRGNRGWERGLHDNFLARRTGTLGGPASTFGRQNAGIRAGIGSGHSSLVTHVSQVQSVGNMKLTRATSTQLANQRQGAKQFQQLSTQRSQVENRSNVSAGPGKVPASTVRLPTNSASIQRSGPGTAFPSGSATRGTTSTSAGGPRIVSSGGRQFSTNNGGSSTSTNAGSPRIVSSGGRQFSTTNARPTSPSYSGSSPGRSNAVFSTRGGSSGWSTSPSSAAFSGRASASPSYSPSYSGGSRFSGGGGHYSGGGGGGHSSGGGGGGHSSGGGGHGGGHR